MLHDVAGEHGDVHAGVGLPADVEGLLLVLGELVVETQQGLVVHRERLQRAKLSRCEYRRVVKGVTSSTRKGWGAEPTKSQFLGKS